MTLIDQILVEVKETIPDINEEKARRLAEHLTSDEIGVRAMERLFDVSKEDMSHILGTCDATRLYRCWQRKYKPEAVANRSLMQLPASLFEIDWTKVTKASYDLLLANKRLDKKARCALVNDVVKDVIARKPNVNRSFFKGIAADMVKRFPISLQDSFKDSRPLECKFLMKKLCCKYDEEKRAKSKKEFVEAPNIPQAYGCKRWRVKDLPDGETKESLTEKKMQLQTMFKEQRKKDWCWVTIGNAMKLTYKLQRDDINSQTASDKRRKNQPPLARKTTEEISKDWPFLFQTKGMDQHFTILTGVNFREKMTEFEERIDADDFIEFLVKYKPDENRSLKKKYLRAIKHESCANPHVPTILLMLTNCFDEKIEKIIIQIESTTPMDEVEAVVDIPATPCIISLGNAFVAKKFHFAVDGKLHSTVNSFWGAFFMLFQSYFVFNIRYPKEVSNTLEFYQRVVVQIAPEKGTKSNKKTYRSNEGEKLQTLIEAYSAHSTLSEDEEMNIDDPL